VKRTSAKATDRDCIHFSYIWPMYGCHSCRNIYCGCKPKYCHSAA